VQSKRKREDEGDEKSEEGKLCGQRVSFKKVGEWLSLFHCFCLLLFLSG
jgi:hypothetical protein